jgi:hypothetical protein
VIAWSGNGVPRTWAPCVAHPEPCPRERAGCGWTGWGRVGRREERMALRYAGLAFFLNMID